MTFVLALIGALLVFHASMLLGGRRANMVLAATAVGFTTLVSVRVTTSLTVGDLLLVAATVVALVTPKTNPMPRSGHIGAVVAWMALLLGGSALATLIVPQLPDAFSNMVAFAFSGVLTITLMLALRPRYGELRFLLAGFGIAVLVSVAVAQSQDPTLYRPTGLTPTANHFGLTCLFGFGVWIALFVSSATRRKWVYLAAALVCVYGVNLSGSRANLAAVAFSAAAMLVVVSSRRIFLLAGLAAAGVGVAVFTGRLEFGPTSALGRLIGGDSSADASDRERAALYAVTEARINAHPIIGTGWGEALQGHDLYNQMRAIAGIFGLLAAALLVILALRGMRDSRRSENAISGVLWCGYAGYLFAALRSNQMWDRYIWLYLLMACVALVVARPRASDDGSGGVGPGAAVGPDRLVQRGVVEHGALAHRRSAGA